MVTVKFSDSNNARMFHGAMDEQFPLLMIKASPSTLTGSDVTVTIPNGSDFGYNQSELERVVRSLAANYHGTFISVA